MDFSELKRFLDSLPEMGIPGVNTTYSAAILFPKNCTKIASILCMKIL